MWAKRNGLHMRHNQYGIFGWYFTGHLFPIEAITECGYPAWISLKHALDVPHIEDLSNADSIRQETLRTHFIKEGLVFKEEHRERIHKLTQKIIFWAQSVAKQHIGIKPEKIWLSERLPPIHIDLLKEFGTQHSAEADVEEAYKFLLSFAGKGRTLKPYPSHWPQHILAAEAYFNSNGKSIGFKKRKRDIQESRAQLAVASGKVPKEDPDLFGDNQDDEPANTGLETN